MKPAAVLMLVALPLLCAAAPTKPSTEIEPAGCVTAGCHVDIKASAVLHGPVAANTCDACHELTDVANHTYRLAREKLELCTYCHEFEVSAMPVIHKPVKEGQCTGCHDPHGGDNRTLTREKSMSELCGRCHESVTLSHKFLHTPVSKGQCDSCHPPHAAMFPKLLDAQGSDLCLACHTEFDQKLASAKFRHKALEKGCQECHNVHGSDEPMQLTKATVDLCEGCHDKLKNQILAAEFKHSVVHKDKACLTCHTAHGGDAVKLMLDQPAKVCMTCHKDPIRINQNRTLPAAADLTNDAMHKHGAIKDGQCSGCHAAHGSNEPLLLTKAYSRTPYAAFSVDKYDLCFSCHDVRLVQDQQTTTATAFRNGERNLHWVHVREGQLGRACAICHTTHASPNAKNIRLSTPYRIWNMPIGFNKTETGGNCTSGCHVPWVYDRDHPVTGPTTAPARRPAPAVARSELDQPTLVSMTATTVDGQEVRVPDPLKPTVILILSAEQSRDQVIVRSISQAVQPERARVIAVVNSPTTAPATNASPLPWPTVVDRDGRLTRDLAVFGWPTALVLQSDGLQVARIGGAAESFAYKLAPYLDVAEKKIDRVVLERQFAARPKLVGDGPSGQLTRDLQHAQKLLLNGKPREAQKLLTQALQLQPDSVPLRLEMARVLIALDKWDAAQMSLVQLLQRFPDAAEAHYLLGTIFEHAGDWPKAAAEYRASRGNDHK